MPSTEDLWAVASFVERFDLRGIVRARRLSRLTLRNPAAAMSFSSVSVIGNALRLRRVTL